MAMKKIIFFLLFFLLTGAASLSQSISAFGGYPYYFMQLDKYGSGTEVCNAPNYMAGAAVSKYIRALKIEVGFAYATKNYSFLTHNTLSEYDKKEVELEYYYIPVMLHRRLFTDTKNTVSLGLGLVFLKPFGYSEEIFYKDGTKTDPDNLAPVDYKWGNSARLGVSYSRSLAESNFRFFAEVYGDYKFAMDYNEPGSSLKYSSLPDDRIAIGINVGIEWLFNREPLIYYIGK